MRLKRIFSRGHRVLLYHRVLPDDTPAFLIEALAGEVVTATTFTAQLKWLRSQHEVVSLAELFARRHEKKPLLAISFDDGLADNCSVALPILQQLNMPASIFVISGTLDKEMSFPHHHLARWAATLGQAEVEKLQTDERDPRHALKALARTLETRSEDEYPPSLRDMPTHPLDRFLSAQEVQTLSSAGIHIHSHGVSHTPFSQLSAEQRAHELVQSKQVLEEFTGQSVDFFAYPVGRADDIGSGARPELIASGYTAAFTAIPDQMDKSSDPYLLPRLGVRNSLKRLRRKL